MFQREKLLYLRSEWDHFRGRSWRVKGRLLAPLLGLHPFFCFSGTKYMGLQHQVWGVFRTHVFGDEELEVCVGCVLQAPLRLPRRCRDRWTFFRLFPGGGPASQPNGPVFVPRLTAVS